MARLVSSLKATLERPFGVDAYLPWSTVVSALLFIPVAPSVMLGYLIILPNTLLLLALDRIAIHRHHLIAILAVAGFSLIGACLAGTELKPIIMQVAGITVTSVYYFNALTNFGISLSRWMQMYVRVAFIIALFGILIWIAARLLQVGDGRLAAIYLEPSHYIFLTLPAVGYSIGRFIAQRRYGWESAVFTLTYVLADSSLGFLGLLLIGLFIVAPRLGGTNASTFALLSNVYVTSQSFQEHPLTGVGIGGYANAYDTHIGTLTGPGLTFLRESLNRDDANSFFLRVAAELGIPGLIVLFSFLILCARVKGPSFEAVRNAILPYLLVRLGRFGAYFSVELYFFVGIYLLNYLDYRRSLLHTPASPAAEIKAKREI